MELKPTFLEAREWVEQLYTGVVCHRIRDVWSPVRLLVTRAIGKILAGISPRRSDAALAAVPRG